MYNVYIYVALIAFAAGLCVGAGAVMLATLRKFDAMSKARRMEAEAREAQLRG